MTPDVIVVGAGSAGCVVAARLAEDPARKVLLLEAGPYYPAEQATPPDLLNVFEVCYNPEYDWGYFSEPADGRSVRLWRARLVGGCSAINGAMALRGAPSDYDDWAARGNPGWSFADVLPFFKKLETDTDFPNEWHGMSGPLPIERAKAAEYSALQEAFVSAALSCGHSEVADHNAGATIGIGPTPRNSRDGTRMSTAITYLAAARGRTNLVVRGGVLVESVTVRAGRVTGLVLGGGETIRADQVVIAAGAYSTPAMLLRSGIGPADELGKLGIRVISDLPSVGRGLTDHPLLGVDYPYAGPEHRGHKYQAMLTMRSSRAQTPGPDLHIFAAGPFDSSDSPTGAVLALVVSVVKPISKGWVRLRSADPTAAPLIQPAHLVEQADARRIAEAVREARRLCREPALRALIGGAELAPGPLIADDDEDGMAVAIRSRVDTYHHPVGTCRMGPDPTEGAVVNPRGEVYGIEGLRVADASIMPDIPSANTNLPVIMLAERLAAAM